ncbi:MAG: putative ribonucleotide transport ATP-binding protein mkl [Verrucomicrobia subdivision 3 bacterium]|nr:putative ribonucleotide transport ATP-binding protein mkl [Limisphaerales bacterium]MCS1417708.1 putative ribonucleotide transport ATP-binding protein mkl [Limisphaerales bacterium]
MTAASESINGIRLDVSNLNRSFDGRPVLKDIEFHVEPGEIFMIMGPSGSGKSVLLKHLIGLEIPDRGEIRIENQSIDDQAVRNQYRLAMVFQSGALLNSLTVAQNVGLYLQEHQLKPAAEIEAIVRESLALVGLKDVETQYPSELSGGMKKRVAIARALVIDPQLIFYDEPTSELDPLMAAMVGNEIVQLNQRTGVTSVIVTHERELAFRIANRIAVIHEGEIICIGTPSELSNDSTPFIQEFLLAGRDSQPTTNHSL